MESVKCVRAVTVDKFGRKPNCLELKILCSIIYNHIAVDELHAPRSYIVLLLDVIV